MIRDQSDLVLKVDWCVEVGNLWVDGLANHLALGSVHESAHFYVKLESKIILKPKSTHRTLDLVVHNFVVESHLDRL